MNMAAVPSLLYSWSWRAGLSAGKRQRRPRFGEGFCLLSLIQADQGPCGIGRALTHIQDILQRCDEFGTGLWSNAPTLLQPGLELVLLSVWHTVSCESESAKPASRSLPAGKRKLQRR
jgi:hypothetical protein